MTGYDVEKYEHAGLTVRIAQDWDAVDPREMRTSLTTLLWTDDKHGLRDDSRFDVSPFKSTAHAARYLTLMDGYLLALPFKILDYGSGGMRAYITDLDDDHITGFIVVADRDLQIVGCPLEHMEEGARAEFAEFEAWVEGDVYGYVIETPEGEFLDSCWGFYGDIDYVRSQANESAEAEAHDLAVNIEPPDVAEVMSEMANAS